MPRFPSDRVDPAMGSRPQATTLRGAWLTVARTAWITVAVPTLVLAVGGFLVGFQRPELISPPSIRMALDQEGISHEVAILIGLVLPWVAFTATGLFIFWRRSDDWAAMLFALLLVVWGGTTIRSLEALERAYPGLWLPVRLISLTAVFLLLIVLLVFPTAPLFIAFPVSVATAILRYRLYDIDRIISRTLVYGALTTLLAGVYAGAVLVLGQFFGGIGGEPPSWAIAGVTLGVAALVQPARHRIQNAVDRRFNRRRYDAARTIEAFAARLRDQVELDLLSAELVAVVKQTMEPTAVSIWLRLPIGPPEPSAVARPREPR